MRILLDTHAFVWAVLNDPRLSGRARNLMLDAGNELLLSPATYWEVAIKVSIGRYTLNADFETFMERQAAYSDFTPLPISVKHAAVLSALPFHHRDPFDRMLIAASHRRKRSGAQHRPNVRFVPSRGSGRTGGAARSESPGRKALDIAGIKPDIPNAPRFPLPNRQGRFGGVVLAFRPRK